MAPEVQNHTHSEPSVTSLVSGILSDAQDLFKQQLRLTREEIATDLRKSKEAVAAFAVGWGVVLVGVFAFCLTLAHLLHWLGAPTGTDPSSLPLWACFAIVGGLFLGAGWFFILAGMRKLEDVGTPLHETARSMKENLEWKTKTNRS